MIRLSAFADEISPDPEEQVAVLKQHAIHHLDLRAAWDTNVLDLSDQQVGDLERLLDAAGIGVAAIGSPIGKSPIDQPFERVMEQLERALELAHHFEAPAIRIFSFYPPEGAPGGWQETYRDDVLGRLGALLGRASESGIRLQHENERDIYGDTIERCVDLFQSLGDHGLLVAFDPANFIHCGQTPYPDAYDALRPWIDPTASAVHVKDSTAEGTVVPAGEGVTGFPALLPRLREDGFDGTFSLEPHLAGGGQFAGFSGPDLFGAAAESLQRLLRDMGWEYA